MICIYVVYIAIIPTPSSWQPVKLLRNISCYLFTVDLPAPDTTMSTQYDAIQAPYDEIRKTAIAAIERENVFEAVAPFVKGARVLELACGTGFYSQEFIKWGARSVVGVDISTSMLAEARRGAERAGLGGPDGRVSFLQADCLRLAAYAGGPFDVVFGAWLLNYAATADELARMFRNIALNLADGGRFVGVTVPPTRDPAAYYAAENYVRPRGAGLLVAQVTRPVEDGLAVHMHADTALGAVDFDNFHLRSDVYETAASSGGLHGKLEWRPTSVPEGFEDGLFPNEIEEIKTYKTTPCHATLSISKA